MTIQSFKIFNNNNQKLRLSEVKLSGGDSSAFKINVDGTSASEVNNIVINDLAAAGGDINAIKSNLSYPNYWQKPGGQMQVINNVSYCLYQNSDAATGHVYNYYYYVTVKNNRAGDLS